MHCCPSGDTAVTGVPCGSAAGWGLLLGPWSQRCEPENLIAACCPDLTGALSDKAQTAHRRCSINAPA